MLNIIEPTVYLKNPADEQSLTTLLDVFEENIRPDGVRKRAYLKLSWDRKTDSVSVAENQAYFQSAQSNVVDGGKIRQFAVMDKKIMDLQIMKNLLQANLKIIKAFAPLQQFTSLTLGLHFIRYEVTQYNASYSSPDSLHIDDEPLVFVHLLELSSNAWGGDNIIADLESKEIKNVFRLEKPMETIILTRDYYHAVTALGSREGTAQRDILLFTVEPDATQVAQV